MNLYETQDFFKGMFKGQKVIFEFDDNCIRFLETVYTDGKMHIENHVEYQKVKVTPERGDFFYVPIQPHRMIAPAAYVKSKVSKDDVYFHPQHKEAYAKASDEEKPIKIKELSMLAGLSESEVKSRLE